MKKLLFLIQISKVNIRIYCNASFDDLKLSATKMTAVSIYCKIPKKNSFYYRFNRAFFQKGYVHNLAFQYKILEFRVQYFANLDNLQCSATKITALVRYHKNKEKKTFSLLFSLVFCEKRYEKTIIFQLIFSKSISRCNIMQSFKISKLLLLK